MIGRVTIGDTEVTMSPGASSVRRYRELFNTDFLEATQKAEIDVDAYQKMGFIMAMIASGKRTSELSVDDYDNWLDQFAQLDMINAIPEIMQIWQTSEKTTSVPKKN